MLPGGSIYGVGGGRELEADLWGDVRHTCDLRAKAELTTKSSLLWVCTVEWSETHPDSLYIDICYRASLRYSYRRHSFDRWTERLSVLQVPSDDDSEGTRCI